MSENGKDINRQSVVNHTSENAISRRRFSKLMAATLGAIAGSRIFRESHQDYTNLGYDPEIQQTLEKYGIKDVFLRMYIGDHFFTRETMKKMEEQGVTVVSGEMINYIPKSDGTTSVPNNNMREEFFQNLARIPTGVTANGQMDLMKERSTNLLRIFCKDKNAILASDGGVGSSRIEEAANAVTIGWTLFGSMLYLSSLGWKTGVLKDHKNTLRRREFLRGVALGGAALGAGTLAHAFYTTGENRGFIEPVANSEVSYIYSKMFDTLTIDTTEVAFSIANDERLRQAFNALIRVRNQVISLNHWYLIEATQRNRSLHKNLANQNGKIEIGFFAGNGHSSIKAEFCKGHIQLTKELSDEINNWLDQYLVEMQNATTEEKRTRIVDYYRDLLNIYGKPKLFPLKDMEDNSSQVNDFEVTCQTPAAILYRLLIHRIRNGLVSSHHFETLLQEMLKQQHIHDGTYRNVSGKIVLENGTYKNVLSAGDHLGLKNRLIETRMITDRDLTKIDGEVYPDLYQYDYIGPVVDKPVHIGLVIVQGIPMTFFQKEDTLFIQE